MYHPEGVKWQPLEVLVNLVLVDASSRNLGLGTSDAARTFVPVCLAWARVRERVGHFPEVMAVPASTVEQVAYHCGGNARNNNNSQVLYKLQSSSPRRPRL